MLGSPIGLVLFTLRSALFMETLLLLFVSSVLAAALAVLGWYRGGMPRRPL